MGDKLPDGWTQTGRTMTSDDGAIAFVGGCAGGKMLATFHGPPRSTQAEAEQDRLHLIAGLEGRAGHISAIEAERDARKDAEIAALRQRVAASEAYAQHLLAALNAVSGFKGMP